ncbi:MAG: YgjV family protein [Pseudomonadota bacterium]
MTANWDTVLLTGSGIAAVLFLMAAPMLRQRRGILLGQLAAGVSFVIHYWALGIPVAALVNSLGCVQTLAALKTGQGAASRSLGYALALVMVGVAILFWDGPVSAFSVAGMTLIALGRMQHDQIHLRGMIFAGGLFWLVHDILSAAWLAVAADAGALVTGAIGLSRLLVRFRIEWIGPVRAQSMA